MQSMDEIYAKYAKIVYKFLLSRCQNPDLAEELTQETFYQAIKSIDKFDYSCNISTWLCAIAKNKYLEYLRKNPAHEDIYDIKDSSMISQAAEADCIANLDRVEIMKKLHSLSEPFKEIMYLRIFGNLSFAEIGNIMGKSENWARVNFYRGKEKLRKEFGYEE